MASSQSSNMGSGGMTTKVWAAKICMGNGCSTIITNSNKKHPLLGITFENASGKVLQNILAPDSVHR